MIHDNDAVINNNYERIQNLILLFKISVATRQDFLKFIDILGTRAENLWPVLLYSIVVVTGNLYINARNMHFSQLMCLWVSYDDQNNQYNSD